MPRTTQWATTNPRLQQRFLDTHRQVRVHLLWGHCSFLQGPVHKVPLCPPRAVSPVLSRFWQCYGAVNGDLLQEGLCHTQVCCTQSPCPFGRPLLTWACRRHSNTQRQVWLSFCGISWCAQGFVWALWASLASIGFDSKHDFTPPTILLRPLLCPWTWGIFFWWDPTSSCCCSAASCNFGKDQHTSFYFTILCPSTPPSCVIKDQPPKYTNSSYSSI